MTADKDKPAHERFAGTQHTPSAPSEGTWPEGEPDSVRKEQAKTRAAGKAKAAPKHAKTSGKPKSGK